ncbi:MAG TPA: hypothetical protein VMN57_03295 [Anaerolineales bacterium]|nr:hypothetical protein [Anaerolineales bacterium]
MTSPEPPLFDKVYSLLDASPDRRDAAAALKSAARAALILFLPPENDRGGPSGWRAVLADLTETFPLLEDAGIGVLVCAPPFDPTDYPGWGPVRFPILDLESPQACELWKTVRELVTCDFFEFAALLDGDRPRIRKEWRKTGADALIPEVLTYLVDRGDLVYTPETGPVHLYERDHLRRRRANAADEGLTADPVQGAAYENLMKGDPDRPAVGMSFSGGGIRAATFTLGVSQALARYRFLPWVDYFSSVSGGGFTASNLVSLLSRQPRAGEFNTQWERFPYNPQIEAFRTPDDLEELTSYAEDRAYRDISHRPGPNAQLAHLLKKANYLIPRVGLATRDLLRGLGALLPGMGFTFVLFLLAVLAAAGLHYFFSALIAPAILAETLIPAGNGIDLGDLLAFLFGSFNSNGYGAGDVYLDVFTAGATTGLLVYGFLVAQYSFPISRKKAASKDATQPARPPAPAETGGDSPDDEPAPAQVPGVPGSQRIGYAANLLLFTLAGGLAWFFGWQLSGAAPPFPALAVPAAAGFVLSLAAALYLLDRTLVSSLKIARARSAGIALGAVFPHPHSLVPLALLFLAQTAAAVYFLWPQLGPAGLIYPVSLAAAGVLIVILTDRGLDKGIIGWPRWSTALIVLALAGLGAGLLLPRFARGLPAGCPECVLWTLLPAAGLVFIGLGLVAYRHRIAVWGGFGLDRWERYDRFVLKMILGLEVGGILLALAVARAKANFVLIGFPLWIWQPAVFLVGILAVFALIRLVVTGRRETWGSPRFRTMIWAVIGMKTYVIAGAVLFALLAVPHMLALEDSQTPGAAVPLTTALISGVWALLLARFSGKETAGESLLTRLFTLPSGIRNAVLGVLVVIFWVSVLFLAETLLDRFVTAPIQALGVALVALGLLLLIGILLNFNFLSPHFFFSDRIVDVFLRTDYETEDGQIVVLRDDSRYPLRSISPPTTSAPYHLVVTAINLAGSGHLQDRDRKSRHFIFSREFVGSNATGYIRTGHYRNGETRYSSTIAVSGAAVSPGLGTFTFFAQSFMMTLLNVRLGQWWLNPKVYAGQVRSEVALEQFEGYESKAFWPLYLLDEAFARTTARRKLVNLTDGGHTRDNGGLYPLFERRCRIIIAGDASQDEKGLCPDLFSVLHYARVDLGVEVDLDVSGLVPAGEGEKDRVPGTSAHHIAVGRIRYPAVHRRDGSLKLPEEWGWLIYVKPAISKSLPPEVLQFWDTDRLMFPHPTTADQFFSERQFEAQRRLGEESVNLSLQALREAYRDGELRDPGGIKARFLREALERGQVDYVLLKRRPGLLDVILRDLMRTLGA